MSPRTPSRKRARTEAPRRPLRSQLDRSQLMVRGQGQVYKFKRTCQIKPLYSTGGAWTQSTINDITNSNLAGSANYGFFKFNLQDLPGYRDFALFEKFRITGVKLTFTPYVITESTSATGPRMTTLAYAYNDTFLDNETVPASVTSAFENVLQDQGCQLRTLSQRSFSIFVRPKAHNPADGVAQTHTFSPWLSISNTAGIADGTSVDHYGVVFSVQSTVGNDSAQYFKCYATYYIEAKGPR